MNKRILIAEDDSNMSFLLKNNLEAEKYQVQCCPDGMDAWSAYNNGHFDLCVLDVMLPKLDGFSLAAMIRKQNTQIPILFLTAKSMKDDVYKGFESGADDYIIKPFTIKELLLRINAVLRRSSYNHTALHGNISFEVGSLKFDYTGRKVIAGETTKKLSTKENELLRIFCESKNMVINRNRLLLEVWGSDDYFVSKSLDVYITRLRKILNADPNIVIQNYHSIGYKLAETAN